MFSGLFLLQFYAIIQVPYNVSAYQFLSLRYTCCFYYIFLSLFLLLCIYCGCCCKGFHALSIFTQILQVKNEFVVIDGSYSRAYTPYRDKISLFVLHRITFMLEFQMCFNRREEKIVR